MSHLLQSSILSSKSTPPSVPPAQESLWQLLLIFTWLGCTSFGGPVAHLAFFRAELVLKRQWMTEQRYVDLVALCQFLPGPASSQVGMAIGLSRHGYWGALMAWLGFTLPSAMFLIMVATAYAHYADFLPAGLLHGLKLVTVAVVAQAVVGMYGNFCKGKIKTLLMLASTMAMLVVPSTYMQLGIILIAGFVGNFCWSSVPALESLVEKPIEKLALPDSPLTNNQNWLPYWMRSNSALFCLICFFILLLALPLLAKVFPGSALASFSLFYQVGSLVFGGGHVVLPMLQTELVPKGLVSQEAFVAGYGLTQAVPGPLFTFAAFLGASMQHAPTGIVGGLLAMVAIFLPSFLLVAGVLPYWENLRKKTNIQATLAGVNAAVVGLLLAAFIYPVGSSAIHSPLDLIVAVLAYAALVYAQLPVGWVVLACALQGVLT